MCSHYVLHYFAGQNLWILRSMDTVLAILRTSGFLSDKTYGEFSRIWKPGGLVFVCTNSKGETIQLQQIYDIHTLYKKGFFDLLLLNLMAFWLRTLQRRMTLAGFLEPQSLYLI